MPFHTVNRICRKCIVPVVAGTLVFGAVAGIPVPFVGQASIAEAATAATYKLVQQGESMVTSGAKQLDYQWVSSNPAEAAQLVHVLQIDLSNPYVQLNTMVGKNDSVTTHQSVGGMVKETGAVAGINADVYNTSPTSEGAAFGAVIKSGELLASTSQLQGMYAFAVTKDRQPMIDLFNFTGSVTAADGATFALTGINKGAYMTEPDNGYSHYGKLYIYTDNWTASQRPMASSTTPTEALVVDGVVTEIAAGKQIATPIPANGYILRGHKEAADFITGHLKVGDKVSSLYSLVSQKTGQSYDPSSFQMLVGGHTILVNNGAAASFSRDISGVSGSADRARTAVGYSKDGKTVYLITVEENGGLKGVTLKELQQIMLQLGVYKGVDLDGGGSTTMMTRPLGEFAPVLAHPTYFGTQQRLVSNGIGVYTTAPQGTIKGIAASGPSTLFIGQQASYSLKAYDTYYNPIDPSGLTPQWSASTTEIGSFQNGVFTAAKPGTAKLTVKSGGASASVDIEVVGGDQLEQLSIAPSTTVLTPGSTIPVPVTARLMDGRELAVPASSVKWEFKGFKASVNDGKMTIQSVDSGTKIGYAIARYDGFSTMAVFAPGTEKTLENFENVGYGITFSGLPADSTKGGVSLVTGLSGQESTKALNLTYDFTTGGTVDRFAYAVLNGGKGIAVDGGPSALTLDVLGDNSFNWLRAEFLDAKGNKVYADIAKQIDWTGWRTIRVDLSDSGLTFPAKLTKLYVVNLAKDQDERSLQGEVAFDNLALQIPPNTAAENETSLLLKIGSKEATVGGQAVQLDTAPFVLNGTTYLPLRFISDALGGEIGWDQTEKKVSMIRGDKMVELWMGRSDMIATGVRVPTPAAPIIQNGRTLAPLRVVSEQLGLKVAYDGKNKTITIS
ncbi:phosphodiester glycosidase family protein [Cohnella lubricantis]|uniref:Phosphodiester glycosidase family protein n=1 Tax=Cohnella lubricantis TaxID=2163172 RepID=A0A841TEV2_9BACL|nr:phosphodiester glycosidase family protein [Cohnella lubricantis]